MQFTPDLLPADLLGSTIYDMQSGRFEFRPGPIFSNLLLADEINRTPPKTQAALLEAMAERQVSIDGDHPPAAGAVHRAGHRQPDRVRGHLSAAGGAARPVHDPAGAALSDRAGRGVDAAAPTRPRLGRARPSTGSSTRTTCSPCASRSNRSPCTTTCCSTWCRWRRPAASTRRSRSAPARAPSWTSSSWPAPARCCSGRDYVIPEDVKALAVPAMAHRISLRPEMWVRQVRSVRRGGGTAASAARCRGPAARRDRDAIDRRRIALAGIATGAVAGDVRGGGARGRG